jgi:hypothetical protein
MEDQQFEARQARLGTNQSLFRAVNEEVERISIDQGAATQTRFVCECASTDCSGEIVLDVDEYEAIRENPTHFFVLPEHVFPEVEDVVDNRGDYVIVEKQGVGARVAEATDNRSAS